MVTILAEATNEIYLAVLQLEKKPQDILEHAERSKKLENRVENFYRKTLSELFSKADNVGESTRHT